MSDPTHKGYTHLTDRQLRNADRRTVEGEPMKSIARDCGVNRWTLCNRLREWRHGRSLAATDSMED